MAIPNIQLGRVASDPMGIPMAASMRTGEDNTFDRLLRDSASKEQRSIETPAKPREQEAPIESELGNANHDLATRRETDDNGALEQPIDANSEAADPSIVDPEADVTESMHRGEPEQQAKSAGKGTDSPRTSPMTSEPLIAASLHAQNAGQQQLTTTTAGTTAAATTAAKGVEPLMRGTTNATLASSSSTKVESGQGAYSAKSAAQAQMLEQARDSVFKQILMKLSGEGGEVRMRLEPPDLGQLDLRMTVEGGNKLSLTISADRQDINQLLHRHLDELKQALQASGLEITGAEVQTRSQFEKEQAKRDASNGEVAANDFVDSAAATPQSRGYITAEGLDFWA